MSSKVHRKRTIRTLKTLRTPTRTLRTLHLGVLKVMGVLIVLLLNGCGNGCFRERQSIGTKALSGKGRGTDPNKILYSSSYSGGLHPPNFRDRTLQHRPQTLPLHAPLQTHALALFSRALKHRDGAFSIPFWWDLSL